MATADAVVEQIKAQVSDARTRLALLVGSSLEGGWGPHFGVGDQGTSFGPFQEHFGGWLPQPTSSSQAAQLRAHAEDPAQAVADAKARYADAVSRVPSSTWSSDPELAAVTAAYYAERPAQPYQQSQGQGAVDAAYKRAKSALGGGGGGGILGTIGGAISGAAGDVKKGAGATLGFAEHPLGTVAGVAEKGASAALSPIFNDAKNFLVKLTFVAGGLVLVVLGGYQVTKPITDKVRSTAETAAAAAPAAAMVA